MIKLLGILAVVAICGWAVEGTGCIGKCPSKVSSDAFITFLPHEDCTMYCICHFGKAIEISCPADLHFAPKWNTCADLSTAECTGFKPDSLMTAPNVNKDELLLNGGCIENCKYDPDPTHTIYTAHQECSKYCLCQQGRFRIRMCKKGLHFSSDHARGCVDPKIAECKGIGGWEPLTSPPPTRPFIRAPPAIPDDAVKKGCLSQCSTSYDHLIAHQYCTKYCACTSGKSTVEKCPVGEHYNDHKEKCTSPKEAQCEVEISPPTRPPIRPPTRPDDAIKKGCLSQCLMSYYHLIAHQYCTRYCVCKNKRSTVESCPAGQHFNKNEEKCTSPKEAQCEVEILPPTRPPTMPPTRPPTKPPSTITDDATKKGCLSKCWLSYDHLIAHQYCTKYCLCKDGKSVVRDCPADQHFSENEERCTSIEEAKCNVFHRTQIITI